MGLCRYADALGKPSEGVHAWRLFGAKGSRDGLALVDLLATLGASVLFVAVFKCRPYMVLVVFCILWLVAILLHRLFCVSTGLNRKLFQ